MQFDDHIPAAAGRKRVRALFCPTYSDRAHAGQPVCRFPAAYRAARSISSAISSTAGGCARIGIGPRRIATCWCNFLNAARQGSRVVYIPGNHDALPARLLRGAFCRNRGRGYGDPPRRGWPPLSRHVHGDHFDRMIKHARVRGYWPSRQSRGTRDQCGGQRCQPLDGSSLLAVAMGQAKVQERHQLYRRFEKALAEVAKHHGADGVICGHIHHAVIHENGIRYINCGDWIESCRPSPNMKTENSKFSNGWIGNRATSGHFHCKRRDRNVNPRCHGCLASSDQRRGSHPDNARKSRAQARPVRSSFSRPTDFRRLNCRPIPECDAPFQPARDREAGSRRIAPDAIHIATEGPIGHMVRRFCVKRGLPFTTSYTTRFPEYISARFADPGDPGAMRCCAGFITRRP